MHDGTGLAIIEGMSNTTDPRAQRLAIRARAKASWTYYLNLIGVTPDGDTIVGHDGYTAFFALERDARRLARALASDCRWHGATVKIEAPDDPEDPVWMVSLVVE